MDMEHSGDVLARLNAHARDAAISFDEPTHVYSILGDARPYTSVTTLNKGLFQQFDAATTAKKLVSNIKMNDKQYKYYGMTAADIEHEWTRNGTDASSRGTAMHLDIERFFNGIPVANSSVEFSYFMDFWKDYGAENTVGTTMINSPGKSNKLNGVFYCLPTPTILDESDILETEEQGILSPIPSPIPDFTTLVPYRTEWCVYYEEYQLAGSIDMIFENPDGTLQIYDWKRCKEISQYHANERFPKFGIVNGLQHIIDSHFWHYALQLNMYKRILETKYNKTITDLYLICLHPDHDGYQRIRLPVLAKSINAVLKHRKLQLHPQKSKPKKEKVKPPHVYTSPQECLV